MTTDKATVRHDDPEMDGTDFAHPAWWRGHEQSAVMVCMLVNKILDGKDGGAGSNLEPWGETRKRLIKMQIEHQAATDRVRELEAQLSQSKGETAHWQANHENQVTRARFLIDRRDIPVERVQAYYELAILRANESRREGTPPPPAIERATTAAAIEAAIVLGHQNTFQQTPENRWLAQFALIGADMHVHDSLRSFVMSVTMLLQAGLYQSGSALQFAPNDIDAKQLEAEIARQFAKQQRETR